MVTESEFMDSFEKIKDCHNKAFHVLNTGAQCEEEARITEALDNYKKGIDIIDEALLTPIGAPENLEKMRGEWEAACKMICKLKRVRNEVLQQIIGLSQSKPKLSTDSEEDHKESNEMKIQSEIFYDNELGRPRTYNELAQELKRLECDDCETNTLKLIFICESVKLYTIKPNGTVTTTVEDSTLRILRLERDDTKNLKTTYFLQLINTLNAVPIVQITHQNAEAESSTSNSTYPLKSFCIVTHPDEPKDNFDAKENSSWIYPLIPNVSPCFRTEYGAFIFPNLDSTFEEGGAFGLVVPSEDQADAIVYEILEDILHGINSAPQRDKTTPPTNLSTQVSENIIRGASFISQNLVKGAEKTGQFMTHSTPYLISKLKKTPENQTVKPSESVQTTMQVAKSVTGVAANVTGYVANKVSSATMALGRFLAPHIRKQGSTLLSKGFGMKEQDANDTMSDVLTIAAGAVEGFGTVYSGLEESAKILGGSLGNNSVKIIEHKYGAEAGDVALNTFDTIGNVINLSHNVTYITPKGLAKRTAKNAGKAFVEDFHPNLEHKSNNPENSSSILMYPNLNGLEQEIKK